MAHKEQREFCESVKAALPDFFQSKKVLAVGDLYINGGVRDLFTDCQYIGIDFVQGAGVDWIGLIHDYPINDPVDVIVSCETWEHDPHLEKSLNKCFELLLPRGLFISTHASPSRPEHGTRRTGYNVYSPDPDFYNPNLSIDVYSRLIGDRLSPVHFTLGQGDQDVYCIGIRS